MPGADSVEGLAEEVSRGKAHTPCGECGVGSEPQRRGLERRAWVMRRGRESINKVIYFI